MSLAKRFSRNLRSTVEVRLLPPFIIEQIRQREERERARQRDEQPRLELPLPPRNRSQAPVDEDPDPDRGVIILDLG